MKLMTKEIRRKLPNLYATEHVNTSDKKIIVKFFTPWSGWTWYGVEYDPIGDLFFGYVENGLCSEWGYFSLAELESVRGPGGLKIERDKFFTPKKFSEIKH